MAEFENKLVVVVNESIELGKAMNALAHAMLGFGVGIVTKQEVKLNKYVDAEGNSHDNLSMMPIIVLKARSNQIRKLREVCKQNKVNFVDFCDTMSVGTYEEEYELTKSKKDSELNYWALVLFGSYDLVSEWTKKLTLYR